MKKIFKTAITVLASAAALSLAGCSNGNTGTVNPSANNTDTDNMSKNNTNTVRGKADTDIRTIQLGHGQTESHPYHLGAVRFADLVNEYTNGQVQVEIFPNATLGAERDMVEGVSMGSVDVCITTNAPLTNFNSNFNVFEFPYLFTSADDAHTVLDGEFGQNLMTELNTIGVKGLAYFENGFRNVTNSKREITKVEDLAGLKIRTMESEIHIAAFKAMGANPTPMNWGEVYTAIQQGTIDGQENPPMSILDGKIYEVNQYLSVTGHFYSPAELLINAALFDGLTTEQQEAVQKAADEACAYEREQAFAFNRDKLQALADSGMKVTEVDKSSFQKACESVYEQYDSDYGTQIAEIKTLLGNN